MYGVHTQQKHGVKLDFLPSRSEGLGALLAMCMRRRRRLYQQGAEVKLLV